MTIIEIVIGLIIIYTLVVIYFKWSYCYWKRKKVPYEKPTFPLGNCDNPISKMPNLSYMLKRQYNYFKSIGEEHGGMYFFNYPIWIPFGPNLVKNILVRDFDCFIDRGMYSNAKHDPLSANVFFAGAKRWKDIRVKLTPTFTSGKMKMMFDILLGCSKEMSEVMHNSYNRKENVDVKDLLARFTTDVISSCAFGLESNSCKNTNEEFRKYGKMVLDFSTYEVVRNSISTVMPDLCRALGVLLVKPSVSEFFYNTIKSTVEYREKHNIYRKDFLQMLIDMSNNHINNNSENKQEDGMTLYEMAAEAFAFYVGGFETSSSTMTFAFIEMALNQEIQERVREEVYEVLARNNDQITYEALQEMTYIQQVIDETLRKYPIVPLIIRQCLRNYKIDNTDIIIDKGTRLFIPTFAIHRDPDNFSDPQRFDPDRFTPENKKVIKPYTYLPFGAGPRNCIGLRFGIMQTKLGIVTILKDFKFTLNKKTKIPIEFNPNNFVLETQGGLYLNLEEVSSW